jgi:hypothetical protein
MGRSSLRSRELCDALRDRASDFLLGHCVVDEKGHSVDFVSREQFLALAPELIVLEDGLFGPIVSYEERLSSDLVALLPSDPVVVVAGADRAGLQGNRLRYTENAGFLGARPVYQNDSIVYGVRKDEKGDWSPLIRCRPEDVHIGEWLRPAFDGIDFFGCVDPVTVLPNSDVAASCDERGATLCLDLWVDQGYGFPWGSVDVQSDHTACLLTGDVASPNALRHLPENVTWISRLCELLVSERRADRERLSSHLRSDELVFLSHQSKDKDVVRAVAAALKRRGIGAWFDEKEILLGDSVVGAVDTGLKNASCVVLCWSRACLESSWVEREVAATVTALIERSISVIVVRLDPTPVPSLISDLRRLDAEGMRPDEIAATIATTLEARRRRAASN